MFYRVTLKLKSSDTEYEFEVDCLTGEVIKLDSRIEHGFESKEENIPENDYPPQHDNDREDDEGPNL